MKTIPVIIGPTCVGKTDLALKIAAETKAHIISIDSRQVFEDLDLGTGKIKSNSKILKSNYVWNVDGVKIFGYDVYRPNEELNVIKYSQFIKSILSEFSEDNFIITCGTGFYLNFLMGNVEFTEIDLERKKELENKTLEELQEIHGLLNDNSKIDSKNKVRLVTRILSLEDPYKHKDSFKIEGVNFEIYYLTEDREYLYSKADMFIDDIFNKNVVGEYLDVVNKYGLVRSLTGLIYKEIGNYLHQFISYAEMVERCKFDMHAYIRRQETYFKKFNAKIKTNDRDLVLSEILKTFNSK